jgi:uncharacterized integral membrane protein
LLSVESEAKAKQITERRIRVLEMKKTHLGYFLLVIIIIIIIIIIIMIVIIVI